MSEASPYLSLGRLVELIADAERFNRQAGVTGVTLYDGARFLSYLEGPPDGLRVAYARASEARSHLNFIELARGRVSQRRLPRWPMRLFWPRRASCRASRWQTGPASLSGAMRTQ